MAKKLSLSEAQLAASGKLPQQQDVMGDAPKAARIPKVVRKHLVVVAPLDAPTTPQEAVLDGNLEPVSDEKMKAALMRAEKRMSAKSTKSEVVKSKADTIDAEEKSAAKDAGVKKTIAGKAQILHEADVLEIIRLSDAGSRPSEIAKLKGVAPSHISNIVRGVTWTHVTGRHYVKGAYKRATKPVEKSAPVAKSKAGQPKTGKGVPASKPSTKKAGK